MAFDYWFRKNIDFCLSLIWTKVTTYLCKDLQQACDSGTFKKQELDTEYSAGSITVGTEGKFGFYTT